MLNSLIGIIASSGGAAVTNSYESISTVSLASAASSITFSSIPSTYQHLQVRLLSKDASTGTGGNNIVAALNSDTTGSNYYSHYLFGDGSSASAGGVSTGGYYCLVGNCVSSNASYANMFAALVFDILDYKDTNKYKTVRSLFGHDRNGSGEVGADSTVWKNTAAVSTITLSIVGGTNFTTYTHAALYGIKG
jgi:hypothetical protein